MLKNCILDELLLAQFVIRRIVLDEFSAGAADRYRKHNNK